MNGGERNKNWGEEHGQRGKKRTLRQYEKVIATEKNGKSSRKKNAKGKKKNGGKEHGWRGKKKKKLKLQKKKWGEEYGKRKEHSYSMKKKGWQKQ